MSRVPGEALSQQSWQFSLGIPLPSASRSRHSAWALGVRASRVISAPTSRPLCCRPEHGPGVFLRPPQLLALLTSSLEVREIASWPFLIALPAVRKLLSVPCSGLSQLPCCVPPFLCRLPSCSPEILAVSISGRVTAVLECLPRARSALPVAEKSTSFSIAPQRTTQNHSLSIPRPPSSCLQRTCIRPFVHSFVRSFTHSFIWHTGLAAASLPCRPVRAQPLSEALTFLLCPLLSTVPACPGRFVSGPQSSPALVNFLTMPFPSLSPQAPEDVVFVFRLALCPLPAHLGFLSEHHSDVSLQRRKFSWVR